MSCQLGNGVPTTMTLYRENGMHAIQSPKTKQRETQRQGNQINQPKTRQTKKGDTREMRNEK